jgi:PAS domain S-box-containing protein
MRRKDGSWLWVRDRGKVVARHPSGAPRRAVGTHVNIGAQREQAQLLHAQTTLLESVLANIPIAIDIVSPDGGIEYVNAFAERLLGWTLDDMRRTNVMEQVYPDAQYRAQVYASMSETPSTRDWEVRTRDGRVLTMEWTNIRLPDGRVIGMGSDVTAVRAAAAAEARLTAQMQQAQKLEGLGLLAGGIAHDFNNLLVGVLGNASLAQELIPPDSEAAKLIAEVRGAATRAAELTRQLLAYAGKGRFIVGSVDVSQLAGEMAALLRAATSKQAVLRQILEPNLPSVEADAAQLRQVVMNLITNASDALGDTAGTVTLTTTVRTPDENERQAVVGGTPLPPGRYVCLEVSDTGAGMSAETIAHIFDPFFTTKSSGHGLGLAATLGIVRSHRGGIAVRSTVGEGTSVVVYLPVADGNVRRSPAPSAGTVGALVGDGDILLADDEPAVRQFAARVLHRSGFTVSQAADGAEALAIFTADPARWRAVVLDLTMPNLGGQDALLQMRAIRPDVPAVLCSGYASEELSPEVTALSAMTFVEKPFTLKRLVTAVLDVSQPA